MRKNLLSGYTILKFDLEANGWDAAVEVLGKIYESTLFSFIQVICLARLLDLVSRQGGNLGKDLVYLGVGYALAAGLKIILSSFLDTKQPLLDNRLEAHLDKLIGEKLAELDPATFESQEFQSLYAQIEGVKGSIQTQLTRFIGLIDGVFKLVMAASVLVISLPWFVILILMFTVPAFLTMNKYREKMWPYFIEKRSLLVRITQYTKTLLASEGTSKEISIFGAGKVLLGKIRSEQERYFTDFKAAIGGNLGWIILAKLTQLGAFLVTQVVMLRRVMGGVISIGTFTLLFQQSLNLTVGAEGVLDMYSSMSMRTKYFDKFFEFLGRKRQIEEPRNPQEIPTKPNPPIIEFSNVGFKYPGTDRWILRNFSVKFESGEKVALVGENGAGKTTIVKLLLRFYDATEGEILINGINIKNIKLRKWHDQVGALFQDFIRYQFTFKENILLGGNLLKDRENKIASAIKLAGADKFLKTLPNREEQMVGKTFSGGIDLSGGQWQKLALARAFFRDAPILILDEPTSAIDAKAEAEIFDRISKLEKNKTVIIISHRFSTVRNADRIMVLNDGVIVEDGNHEELMGKRGIYAELFELQAKGYR